ncbi:MAG TPA: hypothetical protein VGD95_02325 [Micavibrio sp.]
MPNDKNHDQYVYQTHPSLGEKALHKGQSVMESGKKFIHDAGDVVSMPPSAAAVWLAVIVGFVTWKASKGLLSNFGARSGIATLVRPVVAGLLAYGAASWSHDNYLESKGIQVNGRKPHGDQIHFTKPSENFDRAARGESASRSWSAPERIERTRAQPASAHEETRVHTTERRHNRQIARPEY